MAWTQRLFLPNQTSHDPMPFSCFVWMRSVFFVGPESSFFESGLRGNGGLHWRHPAENGQIYLISKDLQRHEPKAQTSAEKVATLKLKMVSIWNEMKISLHSNIFLYYWRNASCL